MIQCPKCGSHKTIDVTSIQDIRAKAYCVCGYKWEYADAPKTDQNSTMRIYWQQVQERLKAIHGPEKMKED